MALQRDVKYSGRYEAATPEQPQGAFKNRTSPTSQDGSYMEKDWLNDWSGFMSSLLEANGITPNGLVDEVGASQYFQGMLQLRQVEPLNNDWNGFFDPKHQEQLPAPAGYPATSGAGGTIYGPDDEWSLGNYSSGAANTISSDDDGVIFSVGTYKLFTLTSEQLALIDETKVPVYLVDETGKRHFVNDGTNGVNVTKPDATTLKVELTNAIFTELGITKVWEFFVTDGVGYVQKLDPLSTARAIGKPVTLASGSFSPGSIPILDPTGYREIKVYIDYIIGPSNQTGLTSSSFSVEEFLSGNDWNTHSATTPGTGSEVSRGMLSNISTSSVTWGTSETGWNTRLVKIEGHY